GQTQTQLHEFESIAYGWIYETVDGQYQPVQGAVVIIYSGQGSDRIEWDAGKYGQMNPVISPSSGAIAFYVPNGIYTVTVGKNGYEDKEIVVNVRNNILSPSIELARLEEEVVVQEDVGSIGQVVDATLISVTSVVETINTIRELPEVQTVASVAKPVVIAAALGSIGVLSSSFNLLTFLRYLFSSPALFFARRKRRKVGTVYNSISKVPIDLATIRLFTKEGKLVKTTVSDKHGRYIFKAQPGVYKIEVKKAGFVFPSEYMAGKTKDVVFDDVYDQGDIEVTEANVIISANIPMDPSQEIKYHESKSLIFRRFLRIFCHVLALSGLLIAIIILIIQPTILSLGIVILHTIIYSITHFLTAWRKKKGWGIVNDGQKQKPLKNTVVRLFEPEFNRLIESTVTDGNGKYAFMAGPNKYFLTFEQPGYEHQEVRPIDFSSKKEPDVISVDVSLSKKIANAV
ncbi:carboxypeptidase-like regulatory domain-containing protein, partial [Patescibacteria group bacterium]|nr:carboxypeptidase-like regulatory domain-containing protein [Patescibacteria group bacterium]